MDEDTTTGVVIAVAAISAVMIAIAVAVLALFALMVGAAAFSAQPPPVPVITRSAAPDPTRYSWQEVISGLDSPLYLTHSGDGTGRLYAVEQTGFILIIENGDLQPEPFLDVSALLSDDVFQGGYSERGLLGLAFHPDYARNGLFFISYTDRQGDSMVARYRASSAYRADPDSRVEVLQVQQPYLDHNGGHIAFGPDGYLYAGLGDGGNPQLLNRSSQDPASLLGKLLRLDVDALPYTIPPDNPFTDTALFAPEVWALGLRNPWRFSFDRSTGDLYIADVGQWQWEELNFQPADSPGGENYGWSAYEGTHPYTELGEIERLYSTMTTPILEYPHQEGCAITGGYIYRGAALPDLQGTYLFGDYCTGFVWSAYRDESGVWHHDLFEDSDFVISSFGEDERGEFYLIDYKGAIYRLAAAG